MNDTRLFRRRLAARVLGILGAASLALPSAGCGGDDAGGADGGAPGGTSTSTGATSSGSAAGGAPSSAAASGAGGGGSTAGSSGASPAMDAGSGEAGQTSSGTTQCFDWPPDAGACPTDGTIILYELTQNVCPPSGWDPYKIDSGPTMNASSQCCYVVELELCVNGGRPFLVDERARVAPARRGARGWGAPEAGSPVAAPCVSGLDAGARASLAEAWTALALLEHASVASFSRVSLQLLAVGAPAELCALTHQAALDEIRHARLCFALASAYAGEEIAPGRFPLGEGVAVGASLAELAASTVKEGCVGETVAAVVAAEQLARATDPAVRAALSQIAADEARHAELAWRTVAWALREGGSEVREAVERALGEALAGAAVAGGGSAGPSVLEAHGLLDAATTAAAAASALAEVVAPAARALLRDRSPARALA